MLQIISFILWHDANLFDDILMENIAKVRKLYHIYIDMMQIFLVPDLLETVYLLQSIMFSRIVSIVTDIEMWI